jgi:hypothetical protein
VHRYVAPIALRCFFAVCVLAAVAGLGSGSPTSSRAAAPDFSPATCFGGGRTHQNGPLVMVTHRIVSAKHVDSFELAAPDGSRRRALVKAPQYADVLHVVELNRGSLVFSSLTRSARYRLDRVDVRTRRVRPLIKTQRLGLYPVAASPDGSLIELWKGYPGPNPHTVFLRANGAIAPDPTRGAGTRGTDRYLMLKLQPPLWHWSPNGRCLAAVMQASDSEGVIRYAPVGGGTAVDVPLPSAVTSAAAPGYGRVLGWSAAAGEIVIAVDAARTTRVYAIDADGSSPRLVTTYSPNAARPELNFRSALERLSPDRQWLLHQRSAGGWARSPLDGDGVQPPVHGGGGRFPAAWLPR